MITTLLLIVFLSLTVPSAAYAQQDGLWLKSFRCNDSNINSLADECLRLLPASPDQLKAAATATKKARQKALEVDINGLRIVDGTSPLPGHVLYPDSLAGLQGQDVSLIVALLQRNDINDKLRANLEQQLLHRLIVLPKGTSELTFVQPKLRCSREILPLLLQSLTAMGRGDVACVMASGAEYRDSCLLSPSLQASFLAWCCQPLCPCFEIEQLTEVGMTCSDASGREVKSAWKHYGQTIEWHVTLEKSDVRTIRLPYNTKSVQLDGKPFVMAKGNNTIKLTGGDHRLDIALDASKDYRDHSKGGAYERLNAASWQNERNGIECDEFIFSQADFPSCHSATIAELDNGDLLAAFFGGTKEGAPDMCIWTARKRLLSRDVDSAGKILRNHYADGWDAIQMVVSGDLRKSPDEPLEDNVNRKACYNPVLFQIPGGDVLLFYKIGKNVPDWKGYLLRSSDGGRTWQNSELPAPLPSVGGDSEGAMLLGAIKNQPVMLPEGWKAADGTVLSHRRIISPSSLENGSWRCCMEVSDDDGRTWTLTPDVPSDGIGAIQPAILVHEDGRLQILCRTPAPKFASGRTTADSRVATSWSNDGGLTWSKLQLIDCLPNNNSGIDAVNDGKGFAVVYNPVPVPLATDKPIRNPIAIAKSPDGLQWTQTHVLERSPMGQYSYPSMIRSSDGSLLVVYTWRRQRIKFCQVR